MRPLRGAGSRRGPAIDRAVNGVGPARVAHLTTAGFLSYGVCVALHYRLFVYNCCRGDRAGNQGCLPAGNGRLWPPPNVSPEARV